MDDLCSDRFERNQRCDRYFSHRSFSVRHQEKGSLEIAKFMKKVFFFLGGGRAEENTKGESDIDFLHPLAPVHLFLQPCKITRDGEGPNGDI